MDLLINALAPRLCFVGGLNWQAIQLLGSFLDNHQQATDILQWILLALCLVYLYLAVVIKIWNFFLSKRGDVWDNKEEAQKKFEDEDQIRQLKEWHREKREKKERKRRKKSE